MAGELSIRPTPDNRAFLDSPENEKHSKNAIVNAALEIYQRFQRGEIRETGDAPTESEEQLNKRKLQLEIDLAKLKIEAMEAKTVIDQAANIKVDLLKEVLEHRRLKNRELRARLDGPTPTPQTHAEQAHAASASTLQVKTWPCTNGCGAILRWPTETEKRKNGNNRPIEAALNITHWCKNFRKQESKAPTPAAKPKELIVACTTDGCNFRADLDHFADSPAPVHDMNQWMRRHVKEKHEREPTESEDVFRRAAAEGISF